MTNSNSLSTKDFKPNKILLILTLLASFAGFLDATYLTIQHYQNRIPPCSLAHGCETVLTSQYATIGPIPISLLGVVYYVFVLLVTIGIMMYKQNRLIKYVLPVTSAAILISIFLVYLQAFVIHAFCQYCLTSETLMLILFITTFLLYKDNKKHRLTA